MNKIKTLDEISVEYSETCDVDHLHIAKVLDTEYVVSLRYYDGSKEALILILGDDEDIKIGLTPIEVKDNKFVIKMALLSYLVGNKTLEIEE